MSFCKLVCFPFNQNNSCMSFLDLNTFQLYRDQFFNSCQKKACNVLTMKLIDCWTLIWAYFYSKRLEGWTEKSLKSSPIYKRLLQRVVSPEHSFLETCFNLFIFWYTDFIKNWYASDMRFTCAPFEFWCKYIFCKWKYKYNNDFDILLCSVLIYYFSISLLNSVKCIVFF